MPDPLAGLAAPAWLEGAVAVRRLAAGPVSDSWRLSTPERDVVLRRDRPLAVVLGLDRAREARALRIAHHHGLAPEPLFADPDRGVLVTAWVGDAGPGASQVRTGPVSWPGLGALLRRVHGLPVDGIAPLDLPSVARRYARAAGSDEARALARRVTERSPALFAGAPPRLCHNDAHTGNVVAGPQPLLLDWEYAATGHPLFDLAAVAGFHGLDAAATTALLDGWRGATPPAETRAFPAFLDLYRAVARLWALAVAAAAPPADG